MLMMHLILPLALFFVFLLCCLTQAIGISVTTKAVPCFERTYGKPGNEVTTNICATVVDDSINDYNWTVAEERCQINGGHLISITSDSENKAIYDALNGSSLSDCWIGLVDIACLDKYWIWIDGEVTNYTHWGSYQPNDRSNCCTNMHGSQTDGDTWDDVSCSSNLNCYICGKVNSFTKPITSTNTTTLHQLISTTVGSSRTTESNSTTPSTSYPTISSTQSTTDYKTTGKPFANYGLISTAGDIALIILTSIFFLTIVVLTVFICRPRCNHSLKRKTETHEDNVGKPNDPVVYYDTQNETAEAQRPIVNEPNIQKNDHDNLAQSNFASNQLYEQ